ncbi:MAG: tRNA preQ1(34) S-adenosylmethionine ribosyltransferase-isomerase QueA [Sphaerochaeta sp.]|jgi:S-adenosylmethionine:tRNA ribosyltransferase-isomerase|nr:tRNA preQ1(34) S-adenosylmethionine ribosyltransferase-isomerase QueA [Sphaerochaeta sp.]MDX9914906.1 tRNA preQ1(34) S-adenosylmethionine ribosyltransferase-isomerase QueA [Sphaerochaeta sp.]
MTIKEFSFDLPEHLIAQHPVHRRGEERLLVLTRGDGTIVDETMANFPAYLQAGSLLVLNDSKVRKARVYGTSEGGATVEFLFLEERVDHQWSVMTTKAKKQRVGKRFRFFDRGGTLIREAVITAELEDGTRTLSFTKMIDESFFATVGHVPLPPYIKREDTLADESRYQTIYAQREGSVASPTAGLHFTEEILGAIRGRGIEIAKVTLHVGPGTFLPVRTATLEEHPMHWERYEVPDACAARVTEAKRSGRPVVAVGTTTVRTLESAWDEEAKCLRPGAGRTNLFIKPGFHFHVVDQLLTNFHTPESTLVVLVSAFAGQQEIGSAYRHAVEHSYRFFSYGDAMFIR